MNKQIPILALVFALTVQASGDIISVRLRDNTQAVVAVPEGQVLTALSWGGNNGDGPFVSVNIDNGGTEGMGQLTLDPTAVGLRSLVVAGPASVVFRHANRGFVTYELSLAPSMQTSTNTTPSTAVVIPTDATGPVEIIMESSADLINWTQALPGTYGASHTNRFFRLRSVRR